MVFVGLAVTFAGFLISLAGLGLASGPFPRLIIAIIGTTVSLFGIIGLVNKAYLADAIWKKEAK